MDDTRREGAPPTVGSSAVDSPIVNSPMSFTSNPSSAPSFTSSSTVPVPRKPNRKSAPTSTTRAASASTSTVDTNSSALFAQCPVEGEHERGLDPLPIEQLDLLGHARQIVRAAFGGEKAQRIAVERHDRGLEPAIAGHRVELGKHGPMPGVHPVEFADRDGARAETSRNLVESPKDLHLRRPRPGSRRPRGRRRESQIIPENRQHDGM